MKEFEVELKVTVTIKANDLSQANEFAEKDLEIMQRRVHIYDEEQVLYHETISFFDCETSINHEVIGHCEISGLSIFEGDDYHYDTEGLMWLKDYEELKNQIKETPTFEEFCIKNGLGYQDVRNDINEHLDRL